MNSLPLSPVVISYATFSEETAIYKSWITFISHLFRPMSSASTFSDIDGLNSIKTSTWNGNLFTRMERFYLECGKSFVFLFVLQPSKQAAYKHLAPICPPIRIEVKPKPIIIRSHAISCSSCHYTCLLWVLDRRLLILIGLKLLDCLCELWSAKWLFWFYDNPLKNTLFRKVKQLYGIL